jgi:hypothetical protein
MTDNDWIFLAFIASLVLGLALFIKGGSCERCKSNLTLRVIELDSAPYAKPGDAHWYRHCLRCKTKERLP